MHDECSNAAHSANGFDYLKAATALLKATQSPMNRGVYAINVRHTYFKEGLSAAVVAFSTETSTGSGRHGGIRQSDHYMVMGYDGCKAAICREFQKFGSYPVIAGIEKEEDESEKPAKARITLSDSSSVYMDF